jgi:hypothetical protein
MEGHIPECRHISPFVHDVNGEDLHTFYKYFIIYVLNLHSKLAMKRSHFIFTHQNSSDSIKDENIYIAGSTTASKMASASYSQL